MQLTVLFGATGAGYAVLAARPDAQAITRVGDVLHLLMSVAMLSMPWPWGMQVAPPVAQVAVFGLGTAFYVVLLGAAAQGRGSEHGHQGGWLVLSYHVVMMAAMVVMGLLLQASGTAATAMPGMEIGPASTRPALPVVSWLLVAMFVAGAAGMMGRLLVANRSRLTGLARTEDGLQVLMSAGMALAFAPS